MWTVFTFGPIELNLYLLQREMCCGTSCLELPEEVFRAAQKEISEEWYRTLLFLYTHHPKKVRRKVDCVRLATVLVV